MIHVVYISVDGILGDLGSSQVRRVLERITAVGPVKYTLFTLEKPESLSNSARIQLQEELENSSISWRPMVYRKGPRGVLENIVWLASAVKDCVAAEGCDIIHARSYPSAMAAYLVSEYVNIPFIFDFRGYWIDERIVEGRWFTNPLAEKIGRLTERSLFQKAAGVVSLTEGAAKEISEGKFGQVDSVPIVVIPTLVDERDFSLDKRRVPRPNPLKDRVVVGFVGSINRSYRVEESLELCSRLMSYNEKVFFLGLTAQREELESLVERFEIPACSYMIKSLTHNEIAQWLAWVDWGLLLLDSNQAKIASMPTKLGEFLASGVRPIHHGCNSDVADWVTRAATGVSLSSLDESSLSAALGVIGAGAPDVSLESGWARTREHFSLESGSQRYLEFYTKVLRID